MPDDLRSRYIEILFNQIASGRYPSVSMLDRVEQTVVDRETGAEYVNLLLDTIEQDTYPSPTMLDRVHRLINALEPSRPANGQGPQ